jgi:zinc transport system substrate-binding protein
MSKARVCRQRPWCWTSPARKTSHMTATWRHRMRLLWGGALLLLLPLPGVARAAEPPAAPIEVFVSILPQKYFVKRVGGKHVAVSVMVGPGQSPETYEPTPNQLSRLAGARIYFTIGMEFENVWMKRIAAANPGMRIVDMRRGIPPRELERPEGTVTPAAQHGLADPHVWTSPQLGKTMAASIRDTLSQLDPAHQAVYGANYEAFAADLDRLDHDIRVLLKNVSTRNFMVFHPAWGYFADTYGLKQIPIEAGGKEPGARTLAHVIEVGKRERVKVIFVQAQFSRRAAETIAQAIGARVVAVDPLAEDYMDNLQQAARQFAEAMR